MKNLILTTFYMCASFLFAQQKEVKIISTNNYSENDIFLLKDFRSQLLGKNEKKKNNYSISMSCILESSTITIKSQNDFELGIRNYSNRNYSNKEDLIRGIKSIAPSNAITYNNSTDFDLGISNSYSTIEELVKIVAKSKASRLIIIWNNGYKPYIFSSENIVEKLNDLNAAATLKPKILTPEPKMVLRPDETHYYIEFDSVGYFPSYEIAIYIKKENILLVKECASFISYSDFIKNKPNFKTALYSTDESKCRFAISLEYIANLCYENSPSGFDITEMPDKDDCTPCKESCLYDKKFIVTIRGCATGVYSNNQIDEVNYFLLQCNKNILH